jgi:hypothetical protein
MDQQLGEVFAMQIRNDASIDGPFPHCKQPTLVRTKPRTGFHKTNVFESNRNLEGSNSPPNHKSYPTIRVLVLTPKRSRQQLRVLPPETDVSQPKPDLSRKTIVFMISRYDAPRSKSKRICARREMRAFSPNRKCSRADLRCASVNRIMPSMAWLLRGLL